MRIACLLLLLTASLPTALSARQSAADALARGDELHALLRPLEALEAYREVLAEDSTHYEALWRAAREGVSLGMLTADDEAARAWYRGALRDARAAVAVDSTGVEGHLWLAVATGRRALSEGPGTRVRLADQVRRAALRALAVDSLAAGAHHVLGQWHAEIRRLNGFTRFAAERILGASTFDEATWEDAEAHLRRAIELDPGSLTHRLELARILLDTDRPEEGRAALRDVLELPAREATDALHKQQAQELLRELGPATASGGGEPLARSLDRLVHPALHLVGELVPPVSRGMTGVGGHTA